MNSAAALPIGSNAAGRPPIDAKTAAVNQCFPEWSARNRARYVRAWRISEYIGRDFMDLVKVGMRSNGSLNVARMLEIAEGWMAMEIAQREACDRE